MTTEDLERLQTPETQDIVERYLNLDPVAVALQTGDRLVAEQVKYLQRAKSKLPSWYSHRCVIDGRLFEQCSSEVTARAKFDALGGGLAIDLTCGLGVDSFALSAIYQRVISVEIDPMKASIARHNFIQLGATNVDVITSSAENFCEEAVAKAVKADLLFVDPSRVDHNGKKVYSLEQSAPNVLTLMPLMRKIANRIIIKLSPLFDVDECFRLFDDLQSIEIVSVNGECKEVNVHIDSLSNDGKRVVNHAIIDSNKVSRISVIVDASQNISAKHINDIPFDKRYVYVPDVAFYKSRCVESYLNQIAESKDFILDNYVFSKSIIENFAGQGFVIEAELPYNLRKVKAMLNEQAIDRATIHLRGFPISQQELYKSLKIKEGADAHLFFTKINNSPTFFIVKPLL